MSPKHTNATITITMIGRIEIPDIVPFKVAFQVTAFELAFSLESTEPSIVKAVKGIASNATTNAQPIANAIHCRFPPTLFFFLFA